MSGYSSKFDEWARRPDTKAKLALANKNAWAQFTKQFPTADKDQFYVQTSVDEKFKISAEVFFNESAISSVGIFGSDRKYWSPQMEKGSRFGGHRRLPFSVITIENKNSIANSGSRVHRIRARHCQNIHSKQNLRNARRIFRYKLLQHISANKANTQIIDRSKKMAKGSKHGILATTAKLCAVLRDSGLRNFLRNI